MRLLLDTHALLWWLEGDARLGPAACALIGDPATEALVSVVSLWEIVVKLRVGKLRADIGEIEAAVDRDGFARLGLERTHRAVLADLPRLPDHRDPFDHLLVAQAIAESATLMTEDRNARRYPVDVLCCSSGRPAP